MPSLSQLSHFWSSRLCHDEDDYLKNVKLLLFGLDFSPIHVVFNKTRGNPYSALPSHLPFHTIAQPPGVGSQSILWESPDVNHENLLKDY